MTPDERLREYVMSVLDAGAVPAADRDDVGEELYGHLWRRMQEAIAAGADEETAADRAIDAFGPSRGVAHDFTRAFHSRLYATTIGALVPAIRVPFPGRPRGYDVAQLFVVITVLGALFEGFFFLPRVVTPVATVVVLGGCLFVAPFFVLAYKGLGRRQAWAAVFVWTLAAAMVVVSGAIGAGILPSLGSSTGPANVLPAIAWAMFVLWRTWNPQFREWIVPSLPLGAPLAAAAVLAAILAVGLPYAAIAVPDPTLVSADALTMTVSMTCTAEDDGTTTGSANATLLWSNMDRMPGGWAPWQQVPLDGLGVAAVASSDVAPNGAFPAAGPNAASRDGKYIVDAFTLDDTTTHAAVSGDGWRYGYHMPVAGNFFRSLGTQWVSIEPSSVRTGHTYETRVIVEAWSRTGPEVAPPNGPPVVRFRYDHQGRWGLEAVVHCGETVVAHPGAREAPGTTP